MPSAGICHAYADAHRKLYIRLRLRRNWPQRESRSANNFEKLENSKKNKLFRRKTPIRVFIHRITDVLFSLFGRLV